MAEAMIKRDRRYIYKRGPHQRYRGESKDPGKHELLCTQCRLTKPADNFRINKVSGARWSWCAICWKAYHRVKQREYMQRKRLKAKLFIGAAWFMTN